MFVARKGARLVGTNPWLTGRC